MKPIFDFLIKLILVIGGTFIGLVVVFILLILGMAGAVDLMIN